MYLETKPDSEQALRRVDAWFHGAVLDRAPVRFSRHNSQYEGAASLDTRRWTTLRDRWLDAEYQVDRALRDLGGKVFRAETFPVYFPNLGPEIYAAFFGCALEFGEITSWSEPMISDITDDAQLALPAFDPDNAYLRKVDEMTTLALERLAGKALVGYTAWVPGIDCVTAWLGPEALCLAMMLEPERLKRLIARSYEPFNALVRDYTARMARAGQPSVNWMEIPYQGCGHIPQTDVANMISPSQFTEFCLPYFATELAALDRAIFHLDGKGVANHLEHILAEPRIQAIQWVQGVGDDEPILQWVPLIKRIQAAGKSVVVDLKPAELEPFMAQVRPEGIFLCIPAEEAIQETLLHTIKKW